MPRSRWGTATALKLYWSPSRYFSPRPYFRNSRTGIADGKSNDGEAQEIAHALMRTYIGHDERVTDIVARYMAWAGC
jgi:hypothetical protein